MRLLFYLIIISLLTCRCSSKKDSRKYNDERVIFMKNFVHKSDTSQNYPYDKSVFHVEKLMDNLPVESSNLTALMYILHSECSGCIGEFLDFVLHLKKSESTLPILTVIEVGTKEVLTYYMEQTGLDIDGNIYFIENMDSCYIENSLQNLNGRIFYIFKNKVINSFSYNSLLQNATN